MTCELVKCKNGVAAAKRKATSAKAPTKAERQNNMTTNLGLLEPIDCPVVHRLPIRFESPMDCWAAAAPVALSITAAHGLRYPTALPCCMNSVRQVGTHATVVTAKFLNFGTESHNQASYA
jgi:hypothetical protein